MIAGSAAWVARVVISHNKRVVNKMNQDRAEETEQMIDIVTNGELLQLEGDGACPPFTVMFKKADNSIELSWYALNSKQNSLRYFTVNGMNYSTMSYQTKAVAAAALERYLSFVGDNSEFSGVPNLV